MKNLSLLVLVFVSLSAMAETGMPDHDKCSLLDLIPFSSRIVGVKKSEGEFADGKLLASDTIRKLKVVASTNRDIPRSQHNLEFLMALKRRFKAAGVEFSLNDLAKVPTARKSLRNSSLASLWGRVYASKYGSPVEDSKVELIGLAHQVMATTAADRSIGSQMDVVAKAVDWFDYSRIELIDVIKAAFAAGGDFDQAFLNELRNREIPLDDYQKSCL